MKFVAVYTTSNGRGLDGFGHIGQYGSSRNYHRSNHTCCAIGGDITKISDYVNNIMTIHIASYPGLHLDNIRNKRCLSGPYKGLTVTDFIFKCCADPNFSGTLANLFLCNDSKLISKNENPMAKVKEYLRKLGQLYETVSGIEKVDFIILSTALHRQADFDSPSYLAKKIEFNRCLASASKNRDCYIKINNKKVAFEIIDMDRFFPVEKMKVNDFYCRGWWEAPGNKIHIRGSFLENYVVTLKKLHSNRCEKNRRKTPKNPFYYFCQININ